MADFDNSLRKIHKFLLYFWQLLLKPCFKTKTPSLKEHIWRRATHVDLYIIILSPVAILTTKCMSSTLYFNIFLFSYVPIPSFSYQTKNTTTKTLGGRCSSCCTKLTCYYLAFSGAVQPSWRNRHYFSSFFIISGSFQWIPIKSLSKSSRFPANFPYFLFRPTFGGHVCFSPRCDVAGPSRGDGGE